MKRTTDITWLAGILEGEGAFVSRAENGQPRIALDMTDRDVVDRVAVLLGGCHVNVRTPNGTTHLKPVYIIRVGGETAAMWMMTLYTLMGVRRQAQISAALSKWRAYKRAPNGWTAHRTKYACNCQQHTGSCQRADRLPPRLPPLACRRGHPYAGANIVRGAGRRWCRTCRASAIANRKMRTAESM